MLRVRGLSFSYPNGKLALVDFGLTVEAGELVVVLGGNGSGKTTLLRCITRTLRPSAGEIWLADTNLCLREGEKLRLARLELAMISQHASLVRRSTVLTNVATGALGRHFGWRTALGGLPASELKAARGYLTDVGLADLAEQRASMLSGGEAQRVAIAARSRNGHACCWPMNRWRASTRKHARRSCDSFSGSRVRSTLRSFAYCIR